MNLLTQTRVETAIYPLEEPEYAFRVPDEGEVIRFAAAGCQELLRIRGTARRLQDKIARTPAPLWAQSGLLNLYEFCRQHRWTPPGGLLIDFQTEIPEGFGLEIQAAWLEAMNRSLISQSGLKNPPRSPRTKARITAELEETVARVRAPPTSWALSPELQLAGWMGDAPRNQEDAGWANFAQSTRHGQSALEKVLHRSWKSPSELTFPILHRAEQLGEEWPRTSRRAQYHLLQENQRCTTAAILLRSLARKFSEESARMVGQFLVQSHEERRELGWKSNEADQMLDHLLDLGPKRGIYGARMACAGSQGFVVLILFHQRAWRTLKSLRHQLYFSTEGPWPFLC